MKASELLNTQMNVEDTDKQNSLNEELQMNEQIMGSPFYTRGNKQTGYFITMGDTKLTDDYETPEEAEAQVRADNWNFMTTVIASITEKVTLALQIQNDKN